MRIVYRLVIAVCLATAVTLGVSATTPAYGCGGWPEPPCCKPGQSCFGGGPGTGGGGGKVEATPEIPEGPAGLLFLFERVLDLRGGGTRVRAAYTTRGLVSRLWAKILAAGSYRGSFRDELRETHLGMKRRRKAGPSVGERLQAAYERVVARKGKQG